MEAASSRTGVFGTSLIPFSSDAQVDRFGVWAAVLCAIHCALTPALLVVMPMFGKVWAHPIAHWLIAFIAIPIAIAMMLKGFKRHQKKSVIIAGSLGILLVVTGALAPHLAMQPVVFELPFLAGAAPDMSCATASACTNDLCCPAVTTEASGAQTLSVPPASILTTAGGMFLIFMHCGNLCGCKSCKETENGSND